MPLRILIIGAGVCGPALAFLLQKSNPKHAVTVIERYSSLRLGGQQIDFKTQGISIVQKMGLLDTVKSYCVPERGMELVDTKGNTLMQFGIDKTGKGIALTAEYEFMRGDLVRVFHDASIETRKKAEAEGEKEGELKYEFDKTVIELDQSDNGAIVTFSDGSKGQFDLVVAADGQGSRTRRLALGDEANAASFKSLGVHTAYYNIPSVKGEDSLAKIYFATNNRMVMTRSADKSGTQVYLFIMKDKARSDRMKLVHKESLEQQKAAWTDLFRGAGWECERLTGALATTEDFYAHEVAQVKMPQIHNGCVALLGDAGYCPTPFTGMGTTLSLAGAYILAGELARHGDDVGAALKGYEDTMQQPITECQKLSSGSSGGFYPTSKLGIKVMNTFLWTMSCFRADKLMAWIFSWLPEEKSGWEVPEYPELNLGEMESQ